MSRMHADLVYLEFKLIKTDCEFMQFQETATSIYNIILWRKLEMTNK